jgi:iron complex transport system ATP-binding protein
VLLLDEPAAALDLEHSVSFYRLLTRLIKRKKITIVVVSHHLNITSQFADRIVMLDKGEIVADGAPEKVLNKDLLEKVYGSSFQLITNSKLKRPVIVPRK